MQQQRRGAERRPRVTDADRRPRHRPPRRPRPPSPTPVPAVPGRPHRRRGHRRQLAAEPQKIVSLTPAATETLFAIGAGDRVVATDDGSDYPAEAATAARRRHLRDGRRREDRRPRPRPRRRRRARLHPGRRDRPAPRARDPGRSSSTPRRSTASTRTSSCSATRPGRSTEADAIDRPAMRADIDAIATRPTAAATASGRSRGSSTTSATPTRHRADLRPGRRVVPRRDGDPARRSTSSPPATRPRYEIPLEKLIERDPEVIILGVNAVLHADRRGRSPSAPAGTS